MQFKSPSLEQLFKSYKFARNNSIQIFEAAIKQNILSYRSSSTKQTKSTFQPIIFQFQCLATTTDAYYRKLTNAKNQSYGIYVERDKVIAKADLIEEDIKKILPRQLKDLEILLKGFDDKKTAKLIDKVGAIMSHEYLHQGQLILMFREVGAALPDRFIRAWAL